jgi:hypothetical protein
MTTGQDIEARAVERLIAEIDAIDRWKDRVARRILMLFALTFMSAIALLVWVVLYEHPRSNLQHPGPRVPPVLRGFKS